MTGILEVAKVAGVSPATVSRALRGLPGVSATTRRQVRAAAETLGYVASPAAAALAGGRTRTVGVLAPWVTRWFFGAVIDGASPVFAERGYDVLLHADPTFNPQTGRIRSLAKRLDGILALCLPIAAAKGAQLEAGRTALVTVGPAPEGVCSVSIDDVEVGRTAGEHLISLGHTTIGFVGGVGGGDMVVQVAADRIAGVADSLAANGLALDPAHVIGSDFTIEAGERAAEALLSMSGARPTALVAASDEIAMGLIHRARSAGLAVPGDLSVIGVDDHDVAHLFGLTTVAQPVREQGRVAAEMLLASMSGEVPASVLVPTRLVVRDTTAPPGTRMTGRRSTDHRQGSTNR